MIINNGNSSIENLQNEDQIGRNKFLNFNQTHSKLGIPVLIQDTFSPEPKMFSKLSVTSGPTHVRRDSDKIIKKFNQLTGPSLASPNNSANNEFYKNIKNNNNRV